MRKSIVMLAVAAMVFGAVSCNKEKETNDLSNRPVRLTATTEGYGDTKTDLHGHALTWSDGDQISVMCGEFTTAGVYQVRQGGSNHAEFVYAGDPANEPTLVAPFQAGYPAEYWNADVTTITLPAQQNYVENGMEKFPMYGEVEEGFGVDFKNVCGVIRLRLTKPGESVTKIVLSTTKYMNGEFGVSFTEGVPAIEHLNGGDNFITLNCAEPVSINSATDFYIYLPAGTYNPMRIEVYNNRGLLCEMNSIANITIERNKITTIAPTAEQLKFNLVNGLITVNRATGKQVRFSVGNLQYVNGAWRFAENQYDLYKSTTYRDQFTWSTTNSNYGLGSDVTGTFVDWGNLIPVSNTDNPWRTLSVSEFNEARGSYYPRGKGKWATVRIWLDDAQTQYADGLVLMPDAFEAATMQRETGITWNSGAQNSGGPKNVWTLNEWNTIANVYAGTFLPAKNTLCNSGTSSMSQYWSSEADASNSDNANTSNVSINSAQAGGSGSTAKSTLRLVRLAQDYIPLTITVE